jgi:hypothetical protein
MMMMMMKMNWGGWSWVSNFGCQHRSRRILSSPVSENQSKPNQTKPNQTKQNPVVASFLKD